jgi:hypothetical protein
MDHRFTRLRVMSAAARLPTASSAATGNPADRGHRGSVRHTGFPCYSTCLTRRCPSPKAWRAYEIVTFCATGEVIQKLQYAPATVAPKGLDEL